VTYQWLAAPKNGGGQVAHLFTDADYWYPLRETACGREVDTHQLSKPQSRARWCVKCRETEDKEGTYAPGV
jgi:hypothetical protein